MPRSSCFGLVKRDQALSFHLSFITPQTRKRKATDLTDNAFGSRKQTKTEDTDQHSLPATPLNTPPLTTMDSDDEFMSGLSSQEEAFGGTQDSDDGSLGDGVYMKMICKFFPNDFEANSHSLAVDFDDDEPENGFSQDKDILKPPRKPYEVEFKVYGPADIQAHQDKQIDQVSAILGQPSEASAILLRYLRWNKEKLIEDYMDKPDAILEKAGLGPHAGQTPQTVIIKGFVCDICFEMGPGLESYAMKCGHRYCVGCYRQYLCQKIMDEGEAARIQCPTEKCNRIVDSKSLNLLVTAELKSRCVNLKRSRLNPLTVLGIKSC